MRDAGHWTPDVGHRTTDGGKSKNNISTPQGGGHNNWHEYDTAQRVSHNIGKKFQNKQSVPVNGLCVS